MVRLPHRLSSPREIVMVIVMGLGGLAVITGCTLVLTAKRSNRAFGVGGSSRWLMELEVGALIGAAIAVTGVALMLFAALFVMTRDGIGTQVVLSLLLVIVQLIAVGVLTGRMAQSLEPVGTAARTGQGLFVVAVGLQVLAAVVGIVKYRAHGRAAPQRRRTRNLRARHSAAR